jgi:hypothetical protein
MINKEAQINKIQFVAGVLTELTLCLWVKKRTNFREQYWFSYARYGTTWGHRYMLFGEQNRALVVVFEEETVQTSVSV